MVDHMITKNCHVIISSHSVTIQSLGLGIYPMTSFFREQQKRLKNTGVGVIIPFSPPAITHTCVLHLTYTTYRKKRFMMLLSTSAIRRSASKFAVTTSARRSASVPIIPSSTRRRWMTAAAASSSSTLALSSQHDRFHASSVQCPGNLLMALGLAVAVGGFSLSNENSVVLAPSTTSCEAKKRNNQGAEHHWTPSEVAKEDFDEVVEGHDLKEMPTYTSDEVRENDGEDGKRIWMSYGGIVYDVTEFIANHPGGSEKIMMAAGSVSFPLTISIFYCGFIHL